MKFGRVYRLKIEEKDPATNEVVDTFIVENPITIRFTCSRHTSNALNELKADLFNLSENVRTFLFQEPWVERNKTVTFEAGYNGFYATIFIGTLWSGFSQREGSDIVSSMWVKSETFYLNQETVYTTLPAESTVGDILQFLLGRYGEKIPVGAIGDYPEKLIRPCVLNGNVWDLSRKYSDNSVYVDNGKCYALRKNEVIEGDLDLVNASSGLLATPRREGNFLQLQILFEPRIIMNQLLRVESDVQNVYNGDYKVLGIQHVGIISESQGGDLRTIVDLNLEGRGFKVVEAK